MDLAQEMGASSWLTSLPLEEFGFSLHKGALGMPLPCGMADIPHTPPPAVHVAPTFQWNMPYHVPKVVSQPSATMKSEISQLT